MIVAALVADPLTWPQSAPSHPDTQFPTDSHTGPPLCPG